MAKNARIIVQELLAPAGITVNGENPWDIIVHDDRTFVRALSEGNLGLGESYMAGWWDCDRLDEFFYRVMRFGLDKKFIFSWPVLSRILLSLVSNQQTGKRSFEVGERHYDVGNDLFRAMLGKTMAYSCGYWSWPAGEAKSLDEAQEAKFDLICRKVGLEPGMSVLDIGCGWGGFLRYAAQKYKIKGVGITVSKEQAALAEKLCKGLPIKIMIQDYRNIWEKFDRIVSVGMVEHVGYRNYRAYMKTANRCLKDDGLFLLHTIGNDVSATSTDPWIGKYIFPNSHTPSLKQISGAAEGLFVIEDVHNFGNDYDKTLMAWHDNFERAWPRLKGEYGERFRRMWRYYLLSCAGLFRARRGQLWQIVLSKGGVAGGWKPVC